MPASVHICSENGGEGCDATPNESGYTCNATVEGELFLPNADNASRTSDAKLITTTTQAEYAAQNHEVVGEEVKRQQQLAPPSPMETVSPLPGTVRNVMGGTSLEKRTMSSFFHRDYDDGSSMFDDDSTHAYSSIVEEMNNLEGISVKIRRDMMKSLEEKFNPQSPNWSNSGEEMDNLDRASPETHRDTNTPWEHIAMPLGPSESDILSDDSLFDGTTVKHPPRIRRETTGALEHLIQRTGSVDTINRVIEEKLHWDEISTNRGELIREDNLVKSMSYNEAISFGDHLESLSEEIQRQMTLDSIVGTVISSPDGVTDLVDTFAAPTRRSVCSSNTTPLESGKGKNYQEHPADCPSHLSPQNNQVRTCITPCHEPARCHDLVQYASCEDAGPNDDTVKSLSSSQSHSQPPNQNVHTEQNQVTHSEGTTGSLEESTISMLKSTMPSSSASQPQCGTSEIKETELESSSVHSTWGEGESTISNTVDRLEAQFLTIQNELDALEPIEQSRSDPMSLEKDLALEVRTIDSSYRYQNDNKPLHTHPHSVERIPPPCLPASCPQTNVVVADDKQMFDHERGPLTLPPSPDGLGVREGCSNSLSSVVPPLTSDAHPKSVGVAVAAVSTDEADDTRAILSVERSVESSCVAVADMMPLEDQQSADSFVEDRKEGSANQVIEDRQNEDEVKSLHKLSVVLRKMLQQDIDPTDDNEDVEVNLEEKQIMDQIRLVLAERHGKGEAKVSNVERKLRQVMAALQECLEREDIMIAELDDKNHLLCSLEKKVKALRSALKKKERRAERDESRLCELEQEANAVRKEYERAKKALQDKFDNSIRDMQRILSDLKTTHHDKIDQLNDKIDHLTAEKTVLDQKLKDATFKDTDTAIASRELGSSGKDTIAEAAPLRECVMQLENTVMKLNSELKKRKQSEASLAKEVEQKGGLIVILENQLSIVQAVLEGQECSRWNVRKMEETTALEKELSTVKAELHSGHARTQQLLHDIETKESQICDLTREANDMRIALEEVTVTAARLSDEIQEMRNYDALTTATDLSRAGKANQPNRCSSEEQQTGLGAERDVPKTELEYTISCSNIAKDTIASLEDDTESSTRDVAQMKVEIARHREDLSVARAEVEASQAKCRDLARDIEVKDALISELADKMAESSHLRVELGTLREGHAEVLAKRDDMGKELKDKIRSVENAKKIIASLEQANKELAADHRSKLKAKDAQIALLQKPSTEKSTVMFSEVKRRNQPSTRHTLFRKTFNTKKGRARKSFSRAGVMGECAESELARFRPSQSRLERGRFRQRQMLHKKLRDAINHLKVTTEHEASFDMLVEQISFVIHDSICLLEADGVIENDDGGSVIALTDLALKYSLQSLAKYIRASRVASTERISDGTTSELRRQLEAVKNEKQNQVKALHLELEERDEAVRDLQEVTKVQKAVMDLLREDLDRKQHANSDEVEVVYSHSESGTRRLDQQWAMQEHQVPSASDDKSKPCPGEAVSCSSQCQTARHPEKRTNHAARLHQASAQAKAVQPSSDDMVVLSLQKADWSMLEDLLSHLQQSSTATPHLDVRDFDDVSASLRYGLAVLRKSRDVGVASSYSEVKKLKDDALETKNEAEALQKQLKELESSRGEEVQKLKDEAFKSALKLSANDWEISLLRQHLKRYEAEENETEPKGGHLCVSQEPHLMTTPLQKKTGLITPESSTPESSFSPADQEESSTDVDKSIQNKEASLSLMALSGEDDSTAICAYERENSPPPAAGKRSSLAIFDACRT